MNCYSANTSTEIRDYSSKWTKGMDKAWQGGTSIGMNEKYDVVNSYGYEHKAKDDNEWKKHLDWDETHPLYEDPDRDKRIKKRQREEQILKQIKAEKK